MTLANNLIACLEKHCMCCVTTSYILNASDRLDSSFSQNIKNAEKIIFMVSEKFILEYALWTSNVNDSSVVTDNKAVFFNYLKDLAKEDVSNIIMIKFSNNVSRILETFASFQLMRQFNDFICCLHSTSKSRTHLIYCQEYEEVSKSKEFKLIGASISSTELISSQKDKHMISKPYFDTNDSEIEFSISDASFHRIKGSECDVTSRGSNLQVQDHTCDVSTVDVVCLTWKYSDEDSYDNNNENGVTTTLNRMIFEEAISLGGESI